jgi:alpha-beta hydrolase superfamily lysophospholipase
MLFVATLGILAVLLALHVGAAAVLAEAMTRATRRRVEGTPADIGLRYEDVTFSATDGVTLHGWYLESPGARASVELVHDATGTRAERSLGILQLQRDYLRRGLNVLSFDLRGRGESATNRDTFGTSERLDVAAAVDFARRRARELPVVVHGFGFGAALALVGASEGLPVELVISDS